MGDVFDPGCEDRHFSIAFSVRFSPFFGCTPGCASCGLDAKSFARGFWYIQEGRDCGGLLSLSGWRRFLGSGIGNAGLISEYYIAFSCDVEEVRSSGEHLNFLPGR